MIKCCKYVLTQGYETVIRPSVGPAFTGLTAVCKMRPVDEHHQIKNIFVKVLN